MYTVIGKSENMTEAAEFIADALPAGMCLGEIAMYYAVLIAPDGLVVWQDGQFYITERKRLVPAPEGLKVKTIKNADAHALSVGEWADIVLEMRGITRTWTSRYK